MRKDFLNYNEPEVDDSAENENEQEVIRPTKPPRPTDP